MQEYEKITFAKTVSKSVLGSMNDLAFQYEYHILGDGGFDRIKILQVNQKINRTPMGALKYKYPIEVLKKLLTESV